MTAPLAPGTLVFNRYRVVGLAGQGEFGLTYLTQDQKRFDELCILKEFVPLQPDLGKVEAARQHFHQAAAVLYELQHPQLPHYRIMFMHEQRLYLVREYVVGKSFNALLHERQLEGRSFSQVEVLQFLLQTLPVLAYLHEWKIAHGNLSLHSVVVRRQDQLPVLIELGLVKQLVAQLGLHPVAPKTPIGSVSFLSPEQQNGAAASPSSGLYGLGAIAIALLVGQDPQEPSQRWLRASDWETHSIQPDFARVLKRMLHPNPQKRFGSVAQVLRALQPIAALVLPVQSGSRLVPHSPQQPFVAGMSNGGQSSDAAIAQAEEMAIPAHLTSVSPTLASPTPISSTPASPTPTAPASASPVSAPTSTAPNRLKPIAPRTRSVRVSSKQPRTHSKADFKASAILVVSVALLVSVVSFRALSWVQPGQEPAVTDATPSSTPVSPNSLVENNPTPSPGAAMPTREPNTASAPDSAEGSSTNDRSSSTEVNSQFLSDLTDELFYGKHPDLQGQKLTADQKELQTEWTAIANDTVSKLESLSPQTRAKLGSYQRSDYEKWVAPGSGASLNSRELNVLVNNRFAELFPEQKGKTLNPQTFGQVWYALAEEELTQLKP